MGYISRPSFPDYFRSTYEVIGGGDWSTKLVTSMHETWWENINVTTGMLQWVYLKVPAATDSHELVIQIYLDNIPLYPRLTMQNMKDQGFDTSTRPYMLLTHTVDGLCVAGMFFPEGMLFNTDLDIGAFNNSGSEDISAEMTYYYITRV